ncbi:MAG: ribonuclease HII [Chitinophagales bacterium]
MLKRFYQKELIEVGCDEAGRGCLAGPVYAAAVILPPGFKNKKLNDSKQLQRKDREELRTIIEKEAVAFAVASLDNHKIDEINILNAALLSMHMALDQLQQKFEFIIVDGNRFKPYKNIPHQTIVEGDAKYMSIAAASILAKTYRDEFMEKLHEEYPVYDWKSNKGYATGHHRKTVIELGNSPYHRRTFILKELQMELFNEKA